MGRAGCVSAPSLFDQPKAIIDCTAGAAHGSTPSANLWSVDYRNYGTTHCEDEFDTLWHLGLGARERGAQSDQQVAREALLECEGANSSHALDLKRLLVTGALGAEDSQSLQ